MPNLVIVESPTKAKTITKFLGKDYTVKSSYGHIRDLPKKDIGIDVNDNFKPTYVVDGVTHISIFGYPGLSPISSSIRYSKQILPLLLKIASVKKLSRLPNYIKKAIIDPEIFEF